MKSLMFGVKTRLIIDLRNSRPRSRQTADRVCPYVNPSYSLLCVRACYSTSEWRVDFVFARRFCQHFAKSRRRTREIAGFFFFVVFFSFVFVVVVHSEVGGGKACPQVLCNLSQCQDVIRRSTNRTAYTSNTKKTALARAGPGAERRGKLG